MPPRPKLTDRAALRRHRARALAAGTGADFLHRRAVSEIKERLALVNRTFTKAALVTGMPQLWQKAFPRARIIADTEVLDLREAEHDLVIHALALHWANDPVGQIVQSRLALEPDGMFLGITFGGATLTELRQALAEAETAVTGGLSPRVAPMADIRELGSLLQRAGLAMPVADSLRIDVRYRSLRRLLHDLRAIGETNALAARERRPMPRALLRETERRYRSRFADGEGLIATFELIVLTGWAPAPGQPVPLRPGSASARLADALGTREYPLGEPARPRRSPG